MQSFTLPVVWTMTATVTVEAESLEAARAAVLRGPLPTDGRYLDDSFQIDEGAILDKTESPVEV